MTHALDALIARVEGATGPDSAIDGEIAKLCGWTFERMHNRDAKPYWRKPGVTEWFMRSELPNYSGSLDAALDLVKAKLPGWYWKINSDGYAILLLDDDGIEFPVVEAFGATPALALLSAFLKALKAESEG